MRLVLTIGAAALAGAVGFFAGLGVLLTATGLHAAGWSPVAMVAGAGLFGGVAAGAAARLPLLQVLGIAAAAGLGGALAGLVVMGWRDSYEAAVAGAAGLVLAAAVTGHALAS